MDAGYHLNCEHNEGYCGADQCSTCEHGPNKCLTCAWWDEILDNKGQGVMHGLCLLHDNDPTRASDVCGCWMSPSETLDKLRTAQAEVERLRVALEGCARNDKTVYDHHEPRPDGMKPRDAGGGINLPDAA